MRLFAAIAPPDDVRDRLASVQAGLPEGRLTRWENLHLTLSFFGEVNGREAEDIHTTLCAVSAPGFDLWLDGVDALGGARPRLLFADVRPEAALSHLHRKVEQAARLAGVDIPAERYKPHVTLKRLKPGELSQGRAAKWLAANSGFLAGPIPIASFGLYRSSLGRTAPIYEEIARYPLTGAEG